MEIDETINKWLTNLDVELANIEEQICTLPEIADAKKIIYGYCSRIRSVVREYSESILHLCDQGKELPAKIILRTLAELVIKFSWCMNEAHKDISMFFENCQRWTRKSKEEQTRFYKKAFECFGDNQIEQNLKNLQEDLNQFVSITNIPNNEQLCKDLFGNEGGLNYFVLFGQLHEIVHSHLTFLEKIKTSNKGTLISEDDNIEFIKLICMTCIYLFLKYTYQYYKLDFSVIESDYIRLKN
ncbi:MAG: hypothetical protein A2173_05585 [Planctomycetes bacterium RBG_13_44_8b]|nr:MAG: hypothetical protein A2173_05585 [Planctomycetes bacterium RBG_13_44_8b]